MFAKKEGIKMGWFLGLVSYEKDLYHYVNKRGSFIKNHAKLLETQFGPSC